MSYHRAWVSETHKVVVSFPLHASGSYCHSLESCYQPLVSELQTRGSYPMMMSYHHAPGPYIKEIRNRCIG